MAKAEKSLVNIKHLREKLSNAFSWKQGGGWGGGLFFFTKQTIGLRPTIQWQLICIGINPTPLGCNFSISCWKLDPNGPQLLSAKCWGCKCFYCSAANNHLVWKMSMEERKWKSFWRRNSKLFSRNYGGAYCAHNQKYDGKLNQNKAQGIFISSLIPSNSNVWLRQRFGEVHLYFNVGWHFTLRSCILLWCS